MNNKITLIAFLLVLFIGCDKVEGPYYTSTGGKESTIEFPDLQPEDLYRRILVEEYTGHRCANCPEGHAMLVELHDLFGDTLVMVGVHGSSLARPTDNYPYDFRTAVGDQLFTDFNIYAIPCANFNRTVSNVPVAGWINAIYDTDISQSYAAIQLINEYNSNNRNLEVNMKTTMLSDYEDELQIAIYVIEDDIIQPQLHGSDRIEDYVHKHVLRGSLNGTYGTRLTEDGFLEKDSAYARTYTMPLGEDWKAESCTVIAILSNEKTKEVIQVRAGKIVK
ncbi:Omp28 family outer membrane lipoprotein [Bacteroidales bacterium OttesenSCG-928-B11]|nr:Omp28 family outer membrane lipoprotein [Bacteroidales bacterium OttesenSCG-928-B11]